MKKWIALLLALVMVFALAACAKTDVPAAAETPAADAPAADAPAAETPAAEAPAAADGEVLSEEDAEAAREAGTLASDPLTGFEYSDSTDTWYYSNYPNYKDFNADGVIKVAFVCKFSGPWFTPKANALGETVKAAGYEYLFVDANSDEQAWLDGIQNIINQDFDVVVMTPVNTALLPDAMAMLQDAGIAYLTTDDPGADAYGFYSPHYGLDDYFLFYETGKLAAQKIQDENFLDGVNDDYSNFLFVIADSPAVEAIHKRSQAYYDAITEALPGIPEDRILWLDCGAGLADDIENKLAPTLQANKSTVDKWIIASGTGSLNVPAFTLIKENDIPMDSVIISETCGMSDVCELLENNPDFADRCILVGLASAPSGVGMGKLIIDLVENGTPIPAFTGYDLIPVTAENITEFYDAYYR